MTSQIMRQMTMMTMMNASNPPPPPEPPEPPPPPVMMIGPVPPLRDELLLLDPLLREEPLLERPTLLRLPPPGRASTRRGVAIQNIMARSIARCRKDGRRCMDPFHLPMVSNACARRRAFSHKRYENCPRDVPSRGT